MDPVRETLVTTGDDSRHDEAKPMIVALGYVRVSTDEQVLTGVSLDAQEARFRDYCKGLSLPVSSLIRETGVSATIPLKKRPGGKDLFDLLRNHRADEVHVIALHREVDDPERRLES